MSAVRRAGGAGETRCVVAMSGGVDSSVAAALRARAGGEVVGLSMKLYDRPGEGEHGSCCTPDDLRDARRVAARVGIPHFVLGFEEEFRHQVLDYFSAEYRRGRTPVPCIPCNSGLKFGSLLDRARLLGADRVVTGHYARVDYRPERGRWRLRAGIDATRDQSYFLFDLTQQQLAAAEFPLGERTKDEVRRLARELELPVAEKPESRDLCFVGSGGYREAIGGGEAGGEIVDRAGCVLGRHDGVSGFTVGQRRGLGVAGPRPLYVLSIDAPGRRVIVGEEEAQYSRTVWASGVNWIHTAAPEAPFRARARVRYRHGGAEARVVPEGDRMRVEFDSPQRALAPGQALVIYRGAEVLGGGWIDRAA